jgi:UDPglucose 6-dehydrogenase
MNISIVGTGYVGLTTGAILSNVGYKVYCIDVDEQKIEIIKSGKSYFYEPGLNNLVKSGVEEGNLIPTGDYKKAVEDSEIAFICVGTPQNSDGSVNMSYIYSAAESISENMKNEMIVVTKSTVPVGTGANIAKILQKSGKPFHVASCPEFLSEGSAVLDTLLMDRIVIGTESKDVMKKIQQVFKSIDDNADNLLQEELSDYAGIYRTKVDREELPSFEERTQFMNLESAELVKVTANAFLATKISFANSVARICDKVGANINEVMDGIGADSRIGRDFLYAGIGWGGGCFPKDVSGLIHFAKEIDAGFEIVEAAKKVNDGQIDIVIRKVEEILGSRLEGKNIGLWGLSFKPGTSDIRESQSIKLIEALLLKRANVKAYDPQSIEEAKEEITDNLLEYTDSKEAAAEDSDLIILATDWPQFRDTDFSSLKEKLKLPNILDARNRLNKKELETLGYNYYGIGR